MKNEPIVIEITKADFDSLPESKRERQILFFDLYTCPLAMAIKRMGIHNYPCAGVSSVAADGKDIGLLDPQFGYKDFEDLIEGRIETFTTVYTPLV